jgi:hypothetical protein
MSERIQELVNRLHEKSKQGTLMWRKAPSGAFQVSFPRYSVSVGYLENGLMGLLSSHPGPRVPRMTIFNEEGVVLEDIGVEALVEPSNWDQRQYWLTKFHEIYDMARRKAMGTDKAIEELLAALED